MKTSMLALAVGLVVAATLGARGAEVAGTAGGNTGHAKKDLEATGILARSPIELSPTAKPEPVRTAVTDAKALAALLNLDDAERAVALICKVLKIERIDFDKQMLIVVSDGPTHGQQRGVEITRLALEKEVLKVEWSVSKRMATVQQPLTHPACVVLTAKFTGQVQFVRPRVALD